MPTWLTVELALIPVVLAGLAGIVWLVRLEGSVKHNKHEIINVVQRQQRHNDRVYDEMRSVNKNLHRLMGKLDVEPVD